MKLFEIYKMDPSFPHDIMEKLRYKFKRNLITHLEDDLAGAFSQIPKGVLIVEDVRSYIHEKFETLGDTNILKEFDKVYKKYMIFKDELNHLGH